MLASRTVAEDLELLLAWREGDAESGDQLLRRYFEPLCRFFRSKLDDDVDDLIQRTLLACLEQRERFRGEASFRSYVFAIARNHLYMHLRKRYRGPEIQDMSLSSLADLATTPTSRIAKDAQADLLMRAMDRLPMDQRIALELSYWEGMTGPEVANVLGIKSNTVRSRLARARDALRAEVASLTRADAHGGD
jgi:RNA polymerase sigma-70 factor (ECF subfamily)